ncbi:histidinol phosphate phosphatase [Alphaproteobacteria bacterium]|nr:histidinol phosphate phosphatase [Alphaproteobacteria bacterium]
MQKIMDKRIFESCIQIIDDGMIAQHALSTFDIKANGSLCSKFEKEIEENIRCFLCEKYPDIKFIGEESCTSETKITDELTWYMDPIDGTISFKNNIGLYGSTLTLADGINPLASMVYFPVYKDRYISYLGNGAFKNNQKISIANRGEENFSVICHSDLYTFELSQRTEWLYVIQQMDSVPRNFIPRTYTDVFGYSLVADGSAVAKFDAACAIWDLLPVFLLIREAGGSTVIYMNDNPTCENFCSMLSGEKSVVKKIHSELKAKISIKDGTCFFNEIPNVQF